MRVLQLIDSLEVGGAERVAVNIANGLSTLIEKSFICATRKEGLLKQNISDKAHYFFLNKKGTLDVFAIIRLLNFVKVNKIDIIHAHSSSFFLAALIRLFKSNIKIVWHDHYGNSEFLENRKSKVLVFCSSFFSHTFCVNKVLKNWVEKHLNCKSVSYLPNFAVVNKTEKLTILGGEKGKRILCLANLRPQKDHENLLKAFGIIRNEFPEWTLHLVGKDFKDDYSAHIYDLIKDLRLNNNVFLYGSKSDTDYIISQADIGVLSSKSEGLPLALIEYGLGELAVITTNVGDCSKIISNDSLGKLVAKNNYNALATAIQIYIKNNKLRKQIGDNLNKKVKNYFSSDSVIKIIMVYYKQIMNI